MAYHYFCLRDVTNIQQEPVLLELATVIARQSRTQPPAVPCVLAVHDQLVCLPVTNTHIIADNRADACTCEKAADGGVVASELETDFTTKA